MKTVILLLAITITAYGSLTWSDFTVKWALYGTALHPDSYYSIPWNATDAAAASWIEVTDVNKLGQSLYCFPDDARFCIIVDSYGNVCGIQVGIPVADLKTLQSIYPLSKLEEYSVKNIFGEDIWTSTVYFNDPDTIISGGRSDTEDVLGTEGIWIETTSGHQNISRTTRQLDSIWTEKACTPTSGRHYYHNMSTSPPCEDFQPWSLVYRYDELAGIGFQTFGSPSVITRPWLESIPSVPIKSPIPTALDCLPEWAEDYQVISMHVYFTQNASFYTC